ncbi:hypothetical protein [Legionella pneumophila]|uniref:hypothetical protein n=1 Tax=Legionella pneumophila TaxID=446 RepID=UPI001A1D6F6C|nr:hypothetical protein [Legionella pneumophila]HAT1860707.1 hypothetical protein [Legionella pneumophila]HAU2155533.1 hypothetical protein [Legionella pneumophila]
MMMFSEIAFAMELIAIAAGISLLIWAIRNEGPGVRLAKIFGYIISIFAILAMLFTISAAIFRSFEMMSMMKNGCPMCKMMQEKSMMQNTNNMTGMTQDKKQNGMSGVMQNKEQKQ